MNVGRNLSYEKNDGGWAKVTVTLSDQDLLDLVEEKKVTGYHVEVDEATSRAAIVDDGGTLMSVRLRHRVMQSYCDIMAWVQLASEGGASEAYAKEQIRAAYARTGGILHV